MIRPKILEVINYGINFITKIMLLSLTVFCILSLTGVSLLGRFKNALDSLGFIGYNAVLLIIAFRAFVTYRTRQTYDNDAALVKGILVCLGRISYDIVLRLQSGSLAEVMYTWIFYGIQILWYLALIFRKA